MGNVIGMIQELLWDQVGKGVRELFYTPHPPNIKDSHYVVHYYIF